MDRRRRLFRPCPHDGDAVHGDIILAGGNGRDHRVPTDILVGDVHVQPLRDFRNCLVFPAGRLTGLRIDKLQRRVGVLRGNDDFLPTEIRQVGGKSAKPSPKR